MALHDTFYIPDMPKTHLFNWIQSHLKKDYLYDHKNNIFGPKLSKIVSLFNYIMKLFMQYFIKKSILH